ncbi:uncharacterized protein PGTG_13799 [Puccinia graminis f. sp. tritici CRL 75-36-700-3]|uniref:Prenyltransferase alpha-alpha toroid domain-containing protein n=1 Tax=Puccinia graminis f. sp. tritici (strain CRL 75-36-700-3 / race SCCL) TaxID=418459 RepID=E3KUP5_PUCGT|nr:uncharacterized protein PGTG_13799 [Puccinia graminis f. sp. tritici CRL 75-36-700-3]EFP87995.1 hypothetical protein PGTG_13799 [Puccinia graminis f. sp. tritici CRL 75-36-700-3]
MYVSQEYTELAAKFKPPGRHEAHPRASRGDAGGEALFSIRLAAEVQNRQKFTTSQEKKKMTDQPEPEQELAQPSHIRYALRHLRMLPPPYQSDDSNRITFGFFALSSLAILGGLDRLDLAERADYIHWIYRRWNPKLGGFGGAPNIDLRGLGLDEEPSDQPHLTHTYTALLILALLTLPSDETPEPESPYGNLDLPKLLQFVRDCQRPNGSFGSFPDSHDEDVRFVYCAVAILAIVRVDPSTVIDVDSTERFLKSCRRYEGGYGQAPHFEAQGGTTYCALASFALLSRLESSQTEEEADQTVRWLVDRQGELAQSPGIPAGDDEEKTSEEGSQPDAPDAGRSSPPGLGSNKPGETVDRASLDGHPSFTRRTVAGFQGRIGKPLDACYSFWCTAGLTIMSSRYSSPRSPNMSTATRLPFLDYLDLLLNPDLGSPPEVLYDPHANIQFLLRCQSSQWGGIARSPGDHPDVYHTYLALASLSLSAHATGPSDPSKIPDLERRAPAGLDQLPRHDPFLNVPVQASEWISKCFAPQQDPSL